MEEAVFWVYSWILNPVMKEANLKYLSQNFYEWLLKIMAT